MTSSDPWNIKPTHIDWSEQVEEELQRGPLPQDTSSGFPTLDEAAKATKGGKKKKPQQKISLSEFMSTEKSGGGNVGYRPGGRPLTNAEIMMMLPTAPRVKDPNQPQRNWNARQGYQRGGGYEREERGFRARERDDEFFPSRADESDNWGADRRGGSRNDYRPPSRGSSRDDRESYYSRASDTDNWSRDNRFQPSQRYGGGYEHDRSRRGYGFHSHQRYGEDRWYQRGGARTPPLSDTSSQGRKPLMLTKRTKPLPEGGQPDVYVSKAKSNPFGDARPREENLRERGTCSDVFSNRSDIASDQDFRSQPGSPGNSFRGSSVTGVELRGDQAMTRFKPREDPFGGAKPRQDPFGGARPREEVLSERGNSSMDKKDKAAQQLENIAQHIEAA